MTRFLLALLLAGSAYACDGQTPPDIHCHRTRTGQWEFRVQGQCFDVGYSPEDGPVCKISEQFVRDRMSKGVDVETVVLTMDTEPDVGGWTYWSRVMECHR